jgi:hypothetical protein
MDEDAVRAHAEAHGRAVVEGDLRRAASDLGGVARRQAAGVMEHVPKDVSSVEVTMIDNQDRHCIVDTTYSGPTQQAIVRARWEEHDDRPKIVRLEVV